MYSQLCTVAQALWTAFRDFKINNNHDHDILFAVLNVTWSIHSDHDQWTLIMDHRSGNGHWSGMGEWSPSMISLISLKKLVGGWKQELSHWPLNFGSLNTVVDRRSDEQGVGGIMAQIEQRIRRGIMVFGIVYGEEKFKNSKRKKVSSL